MDRDTEQRLLSFCEEQRSAFDSQKWLDLADQKSFDLVDLCSAAFLLRTIPNYGNGLELLAIAALMGGRLKAAGYAMDTRSPAQVIRAGRVDPTRFRSMMDQAIVQAQRTAERSGVRKNAATA